MPTLREKAEYVVDEICFCDFRSSEGVEKAERIIANAFREVSDNTKLACNSSLQSLTSGVADILKEIDTTGITRYEVYNKFVKVLDGSIAIIHSQTK